MNAQLLPAFICGRKKPLTKSEYIDLSKRITVAKKKWDALRLKYPNKTTREIIALEKQI